MTGRAKRILITGGAGFIGSNLIRNMIRDYRIICLDRVSYAGNPVNLQGLTDTLFLAPGYPPPKRDGGLEIRELTRIPDDRLVFIVGAVNDFEIVTQILDHVDGVIHLAAETHVDRSIMNPGPFLRNDLLGTYSLLEAVRGKKKDLRLLHVSTDEIYGSAGPGSRFTEQDPINPTNPYSVSKAAADRLVYTYHKGYGVEALIVRPSNNYGPYQHIEKLIPFLVASGLKGLPLFLYGDGRNVRSWIYVEDCCRAIRSVFERGKAGTIYNIPGYEEVENKAIAEKLCELLDVGRSRIEFIKDRPVHDRRYSLNGGRIFKDLGFKPTTDIATGLKKTVDWYKKNQKWWLELWDDEFDDYLHDWYGGLGASTFKKS